MAAQAEFATEFKFTGEWKGRTAGGSPDHPICCLNPHYDLLVHEHSRLDIELSQDDNKRQENESLPLIGVMIIRVAADSDHRVYGLSSANEVVASSGFRADTHVTLSTIVEPPEEGFAYVLLACTLYPLCENRFTLKVAATIAVAMARLPEPAQAAGIATPDTEPEVGEPVAAPERRVISADSAGKAPTRTIAAASQRRPSASRLDSQPALTLNLHSVSEEDEGGGRNSPRGAVVASGMVGSGMVGSAGGDVHAQQEADTEFVDELRQRMCMESYKPGEYIVRAGEEGSCMYFISSGMVEVELPFDIDVSNAPTFGPGCFFGEVALFQSANRRTASVVALTAVDVYVLSKEVLDEALWQYPRVHEQFSNLARSRVLTDAARATNSGATPGRRGQKADSKVPKWMGKLTRRFSGGSGPGAAAGGRERSRRSSIIEVPTESAFMNARLLAPTARDMAVIADSLNHSLSPHISLASFLESLVSPGSPLLTSFTVACRVQDAENLVSCLVDVFAACGRRHELVNRLVGFEVRRTAHNMPTTLFRSNSLATKVMTCICKRDVAEWLASCLMPVFDTLCNVSAPNSTTRDEDIELAVKLAHMALDGVLAGCETCPHTLRHMVATVTTHCADKFPDHLTSVQAGLVFLRMVCPALVAPETWGIIEPPTPQQRCVLVAVSRMVQRLANGVEFSETDRGYKKINLFINSRMEDMATILSNLANAEGFLQRRATARVTSPFLATHAWEVSVSVGAVVREVHTCSDESMLFGAVNGRWGFVPRACVVVDSEIDMVEGGSVPVPRNIPKLDKATSADASEILALGRAKLDGLIDAWCSLYDTRFATLKINGTGGVVGESEGGGESDKRKWKKHADQLNAGLMGAVQSGALSPRSPRPDDGMGGDAARLQSALSAAHAEIHVLRQEVADLKQLLEERDAEMVMLRMLAGVQARETDDDSESGSESGD